MSNRKTIVVTGAAGFIGSHVARNLLDAGCRVVGIDNFNDYYSVDLKEARHARLEKHEAYTGYRLDLCDAAGLADVFKTHSPSIICHLAAQAGVRYSFVNPRAYERSNLEGFFNIINLSKEAGVKRFVYASSSSVYGENTKLPFSEEDRVDHPKSLYAATKRSNELLAYTYTKLFGLQTVGLRFFTVYGPWGRPDMSLYLFADAIVRGNPIQVFNHGQMKRDFTYIDDIVSGVRGALFEEHLDPYEIFNLGNNRSEDLMDLIGLIESTLGKKAEKQFQDMQPGDVEATYADINRAVEKLGYEPKTTIREGVPRFIEWFRDHHSI